MKRKKILKALICSALSFSLVTGGLQVQAAPAVQTPNYCTVTEVFDWGPSISKLIVNLGTRINQRDIDNQTFKVQVRRVLAEGSLTIAEAMAVQNPIVTLGSEARDGADLVGERQVTHVFVCDEKGNPASSGNFVTIEMSVSPTNNLAAALNFDLKTFLNDFVTPEYTITLNKNLGNLNKNNFVVSYRAGNIRPIVDEFTFGHYKLIDEPALQFGKTLGYAAYAPKNISGKVPLIVWLHGGGEGGQNTPSLPIMGNKATMLAESPIQDYFGGAYVLAPQCPTAWMEGYEGWADGKPIYEDILMALIKDLVASNPNIDQNRIYVGGDSNGGYMTLCLARDYPGYFAAGFPVCEGLNDRLISNGDLENIAKTPLWFVAAKTDTTLPPDINSVPTVARLREIGANVHFSYYDDVHDTSGLYKKDDGTPHVYAGHWSWIYVHNNEVEEVINGRTVKLFEWLAQQRRQTLDFINFR